MTTVFVAGALANKAGSGGEAWVRMSWVRGLERLGLDVWFVEQVDHASDDALAYFDRVVAQFGLTERAVLMSPTEPLRGPLLDAVLDAADGALLVNISGHLDHPLLFGRFARRAYVDIDPGFTQSWHADGLSGARLAGHDLYFTIAERIGQPDCPIPTCGVQWRGVRQPVVLDDWPVVPAPDEFRFTTVGSWRAPFGPVTLDGTTYGLKVHEFRRVLALPRLAEQRFELALDIHPADDADRTALVDHGWTLVDPRVIGADPLDFRRYVQSSGAEFSVAQGVYVGTRSGWFSDRTVRYLASGRPALVQDTGFSSTIPSGLGLVGFTTIDDAARSARDIARRSDEHGAAARALAESHFDANRVLARFCDQCGLR